MSSEIEACRAAIRALRAEVVTLRGHVEALVVYDSYQTEYDGQMLEICPDCGKQDGEHSDTCAFVLALAELRKPWPSA